MLRYLLIVSLRFKW